MLVGSAEALWPIVVKDLEKGKLKPLYQSDKYIDQKSLEIQSTTLSQDVKLVGAVEATRGCPYKCDFCQDSNIMHGSVFRK